MSLPDPFEPGELLHHREWVSRLARRLCRDQHAAEDSVQTVFAQALRRPPPHRDNLRGWLTQLLRNTIGMDRRANQRRHAREQHLATIPRDAHVEATADAVLRTEAHRRLVDLVLQLPEPQRGLVLRHYFEDAPVADLVGQSGQSADAIRAHLRRARERLRSELERGDERQRRGLLLLAGATRGELAVTATVAGGLLMTTMLKVGYAALAAAAALLWWSPCLQVTPPAPTATTAQVPAVAASGALQEQVATDTAPQRLAQERLVQELPQDESSLPLRGQLVGLQDGIPWRSRIVIRAQGKVDDNWLEHAGQTTAEPAGTFGFELPGWARYAKGFELTLSADGEDAHYDWEVARFDQAAMQRREPLSLPVTLIGQLQGRVIDETGNGVAAARVCAYLAPNGLPVSNELSSCNTDAAGYYTLRTPADGDLVLMALPMQPAQLSGMRLTTTNGGVLDSGRPRLDLLPTGVLVQAAFGEQRGSPVHRLPAASLITVRVVPTGGLPTDAVQVRMDFPDKPLTRVGRHPSRLTIWDLQRCALVPFRLQLEHGEGVLALPTGARVNLWPIALHQSVLPCAQTVTEAAAPANCTLELRGSLRTVVVFQGGAPIVDATVRTVASGMTYRATTDDQGRCQVLTQDGSCAVTVQAFGCEPVSVTFAAQQPDPLSVELPEVIQSPLTIATRGEWPVLSMSVQIEKEGLTRVEDLSRTDAAQPFLANLPPNTYRVEVRPPQHAGTRDSFLIPSWRNVTVGPAGWTEDWTVEHGGRCRVEVINRGGVRENLQLTLHRPYCEMVWLSPQPTSDSLISPNLSPGDYTLRQPGGLALAEVHITAFETTVVRVQLR